MTLAEDRPRRSAANIFPDYLMIRDTQLNDDAGGLGQRIYTTAGAGYAKVKYIRADLVEGVDAPTQIPNCS